MKSLPLGAGLLVVMVCCWGCITPAPVEEMADEPPPLAAQCQPSDRDLPARLEPAFSARQDELLCHLIGYPGAAPMRELFTVDDSAALFAVLADPDAGACWSNAIFTLGDVLGEDGLDALIGLMCAADQALIETRSRRALYQRPYLVMLALARFALRHPPSEAARDFLIGATDPDSWAAYPLLAQTEQFSPYTSDTPYRQRNMSRIALTVLIDFAPDAELAARCRVLLGRDDLPPSIHRLCEYHVSRFEGP